MRRRLASAVVVLVFGVFAANAEKQGAVDWIFLVDTSRSMIGQGAGSKNIFEDVKASIETFVAAANVGDTITIFTFDRDVELKVSTDIGGGTFEQQELIGLVHDLEATGNHTHLGAAIAKGLEKSEALMKRGDATRQRTIVLFTDGKEYTTGIPNPIPIPDNVQRVQESRPWIFFVSMGEHEPQLDQFANDPAVRDRTKVLRPQDPEAIRQATNDIRTRIQEVVEQPPPPPPPPPEPAVLTVTPPSISFGDVDPGDETEAREISVSSDKPVRVAVALVASPGITMEPLENLSVTPGTPARVKVRLDVDDDVTPGPKGVTVSVTAANGETQPVTATTATASFYVIAPSPGWRIAKWVGAILVLLLLALLAAVMYTRKSPKEILRAFRERNELEGEIEIIEPKTAPDLAYVGLPGKETSELAISSIVSPEVLDGADARIHCRRSDGKKKIWITADRGTLRVNDLEVPLSELYNDDTIQIGQAKLRFNRVGYDRPSDTFDAQEDRS